MRNIVKAGELLAGSGQGTVHGLQLAVRVHSRAWRKHSGDPFRTQRYCARCCGALQKTAAVDVLGVCVLRRNLRRWNIGRFADRHGMTSLGEELLHTLDTAKCQVVTEICDKIIEGFVPSKPWRQSRLFLPRHYNHRVGNADSLGLAPRGHTQAIRPGQDFRVEQRANPVRVARLGE